MGDQIELTLEDPSAKYKAMRERWLPAHTLWGGTKAMREAGEKYLPRMALEDQLDWEKRRDRSFLYNQFKRAVVSLAGKVFSKPIILKDDVQQDVKDLCENIDNNGANLDVFSKRVFVDGLIHGISYIMVDNIDFDDTEGATLANVDEAGIRPYFVHVKCENLIGWKETIIDGVKRLKQVRIYDQFTKDDGAYSERIVERVRVINLDTYEIWERDGTAPAQGNNKQPQWIKVKSGPNPLGEVNLVPFYAQYEDFMEASPPLEDLADKNIEHWQSASDQRNILHVARVPILFGKDIQKTDDEGNPVEIGANRMIIGGASSDLKYVEHTGAAINAGRQDLQDIEDQMAVLSYEPLLPKSGLVTATAKSIDAAEANSVLQAMTISLGDTIELCFGFLSVFLGRNKTEGGSVRVNDDFGLSLRDATDLQALIQMREKREITQETLLVESKRRRLLSDDTDIAAEIVATDAEKEKERKMAQEDAELAAKMKAEQANDNEDEPQGDEPDENPPGPGGPSSQPSLVGGARV